MLLENFGTRLLESSEEENDHSLRALMTHCRGISRVSYSISRQRSPPNVCVDCINITMANTKEKVGKTRLEALMETKDAINNGGFVVDVSYHLVPCP